MTSDLDDGNRRRDSTLKIPLTAILVSGRLRRVDADHVTAIADSMSIKGQLTPITVRRIPQDGPIRFALVAGAHRFEAARRIGLDKLHALIVSLSEEEARLAEIDENLIRHELTPLDRARFLAERKRLFSKVYPERVGQLARARGRSSAENISAEEETMWTFGEEVAAKLGLSSRTVNRAVFIGERILPELMVALLGQPKVGEGVLYKLAQMHVGAQRSVLMALSAAEPSDLATAIRQATQSSANPDAIAITKLAAKLQRTPDSILEAALRQAAGASPSAKSRLQAIARRALA